MSSKKGQQGKGSKLHIRKCRTFSESFRKARVKDLQEGVMSIKEICELYEVSRTAVYKWIYKYSPHHERGSIQVVQMKSEASKTKALQSRVQELESALGRKQLELDFLSKLIDLAGKELGVDLKKKYGSQ